MTALEYAEGLLSPVTEEHEAEARIIISDLTALPIGRINIEAPPLSAALKESIDGIAKRRAQGEPLQYILGKWEFMGLPFYTRPCALIPRQDTETLCEEALAIGGRTLLDLCCGTGCIGVSLAKLGGFEVTFGDISRDCLALARENAALNGIGKDRYTVLVGDVLSNGALRETLGGGYDVVVANIVADVIIGLAPMVRQFLKPGGLFLCSGIIDTRAEEVADALRQNGWEIETTRSGEGWYSYACR